jgi:hypothetical protein
VDGNYYLLAKIDGSIIAGNNPATDIVASPAAVAVHAPFTDLGISFLRLPAHPVEIDGASSGNATAAVRIVNEGNSTARGNVSLGFYLSSDATLDASDPLLATVPNRAIRLRANAAKTFTFNIAVPPNTAIGGYFLFAVMTPGSGIVDTNSNNNVAISSQRVAVVNRLPRPPVEQVTQTTDVGVAFYDGPDYYGFDDDDSIMQSTTDGPDSSTQPAPADSGSSDNDSSTDSWDDSDDPDPGGSFD